MTSSKEGGRSSIEKYCGSGGCLDGKLTGLCLSSDGVADDFLIILELMIE